MATITVRGRFVLPHSQKAKRKENVVWVEAAGASVHVIFLGETPVDFRTDNPARARVIGVVKDDVDMGSYPYRLGGIAESEPESAATDGSVLADPELIVSGGLTRKRKRTKRVASKGAKKAGKRAPAKSAKPAQRRKSTKRATSTRRVGSRKGAAKKR